MPVATLGRTGGQAFANLGGLTAPGISDPLDARDVTGGVTLQLSVEDIGTNVVIRWEGSVDAISYFGLESDRTITANGTIGFSLPSPPAFLRLRLVSLSGGTPTVTPIAGAGGQ